MHRMIDNLIEISPYTLRKLLKPAFLYTYYKTLTRKLLYFKVNLEGRHFLLLNTTQQEEERENAHSRIEIDKTYKSSLKVIVKM